MKTVITELKWGANSKESACKCKRCKRCGSVSHFGRSLGKETATHSCNFAWKSPWIEEPARLQSMGLQRVGHDWLHFHFSLSCIGKGNGNPLQCSYLEKPRDGVAWWAAIYGITQSRTRLKWLASSSSSILNKNILSSLCLVRQPKATWEWAYFERILW